MANFSQKLVQDYINELVRNVDNGEIIRSVSFNQFTDFSELPNSMCIYASSVLDEMRSNMRETISDNKERGFFIYGREIAPNIILFVKTGNNKFKTSDGVINNGAVDVTEESANECIRLLSPNQDGYRKYDCVAHFHTHPDLHDGLIPEKYSDQDLYIYAYLNTKFIELNNPGGRITPSYFLGTLMCPKKEDEYGGRIMVSTVFYDKDHMSSDNQLQFFKLPIYEMTNDTKKLYSINGENLCRYESASSHSLGRMATGYYSSDVTDSPIGKKTNKLILSLMNN